MPQHRTCPRGELLFEDRFHQRPCHGGGVFVLCEVFAQQFGDRGGAPRRALAPALLPGDCQITPGGPA
jgi:hypothetical protein